VVVAFDRMRAIKEIDRENQVAVVEPGVTLEELDRALAPLGLVYPVSPGEVSASLGGNVATNAGGMRAVRYGVTRHHVLGLEVVLADGTVMRTGGKFVKSSSGYDLTQLLVGSEGTLAVTTEITLKLHPRLVESATVLAPFATLAEVAQAVPPIVSSGVDPSILEYIDVLAMSRHHRKCGPGSRASPKRSKRRRWRIWSSCWTGWTRPGWKRTSWRWVRSSRRSVLSMSTSSRAEPGRR
jgi:glycolate oxidase